jgi:hypothetical protein
MLGKVLAIAAAITVVAAPTSLAATRDTASAEASPGPYRVGEPITFTSTTPCTTACRLIWTYLSGTRLGEKLGEGVSVSRAFSTPGLKTVQLRLTELCVGSPRLTCASVAYVSVNVEQAETPADTTAPTFTVSGLTAEATGPSTVVNYTFEATDPDDAVISQSCTPEPGSSFPVGSTPIDCTAVDSNGNVGNETFSVFVTDTTAPELVVPSPTTTEATSPAGAAVDFAVSATDLVDGALTPSCSWQSGSTFPVGSTTVDCSVSDAHNNSSSASFVVVVTDTTAPTLTVPGPITVDATSPAGAVVMYTATASDLVDGALAPSCSSPSGATFPIGTTTVSCTATDSHGNTSAASTFTVRVDGAAAQLADVLQVVQQWNVRGRSVAEKLSEVIAEITQRPRRTCDALGDFDRALRGSLGRRLTAEQLAWLRGQIDQIENVLGCSSAPRDGQR